MTTSHLAARVSPTTLLNMTNDREQGALSEWPGEYPDSCPPPEAEPSSGAVFRLVAGSQPTPKDFVSVYALRPARFKDYEADDLCISMGLSVFDSKEDAERTRQSIAPFRNKSIAVGSIDGSGLMQATPSKDNKTHRTWWRPENDDRWISFEVVE